MRTLLRTLTCILLAAAVAGCGLIYQPTVQQGNLLDKKTVEKLKPGMTKRQVLVLMGSPSVASPFDHDRWDYVYTSSIRGRDMTQRALTLYFNNDTLVRTEGDFFTGDTKKMLEQAKEYNMGHIEDGDVETDKSSGDSDKPTDGGDEPFGEGEGDGQP